MINIKTAEWETIRDAILTTIDQMILHKHSDNIEVYRLMKAAWLEKCEEIYKRHEKEKRSEKASTDLLDGDSAAEPLGSSG